MKKIDFSKCIKNKNDKLLLISIIGNYLVKGGALVVSLFIMPAYMNYFHSNTMLGMWFTVIQLLNWIMLLDFGVGSGIRNKIIEPLKNGDRTRVISLISNTYISVVALVFSLTFVHLMIVEKINWYSILSITSKDISQSQLILMINILVIGIIVRFFSVIISQILYALQKSILPNAMILTSNIIILVFLVFYKGNEENNIIILAYVNSIANNIPALIVTVWIFRTTLKGFWPRVSYFSMQVVKEVLGTGGILFYIQIIFMLLFNVKEIYISWFIGTAEVVEYQIYYKLIGIIGGLYALALNPVWSAVTKAIVDGNKIWIQQLYKKAMYIIAAFGCLQFILVIMMPIIVRIWLGAHAIKVSFIYGVIFSLYNVIYMWMMLNYNFACGMGRTKIISIYITFAAIANYILTIYACRILHSWISVIIATAIVSLPCAFVIQRDIKAALNLK